MTQSSKVRAIGVTERDAHGLERTTLALRRLVEAYALAADRCDADWFSGLWLPDATLSVFDGETTETGAYEGAEAMRGVTKALGRYLRTVHLVSTHRAVIDADGRSATGETYCIAHHLRAPAGAIQRGELICEDQVMTIRYDDRYGRDTSGRWRFAARQCHKLWTRIETVRAFVDGGTGDRLPGRS